MNIVAISFNSFTLFYHLLIGKLLHRLKELHHERPTYNRQVFLSSACALTRRGESFVREHIIFKEIFDIAPNITVTGISFNALQRVPYTFKAIKSALLK
jgi:hypothetical protein